MVGEVELGVVYDCLCYNTEEKILLDFIQKN